MSSERQFVFVPNRLGNLLKAPGGISREGAVTEAKRGIETLRDTSAEVLRTLIAEMEDIVAAGSAERSSKFSSAQMAKLLDRAESVINYAALFGYTDLNSVTASLCELIVVMLDCDISSVGPIAVHVQAMRLVGPDAGETAPGELQTMHVQLRRILEHLLEQPRTPRTDADDPPPQR